LTVRFGGLVAVNDVTFSAPLGQITGLIGPNGAGKTTVFDAISGLNRPASGLIRFGGANVTRLGPAARSRHGIGRTFQRFELCESLSTFDNVSLGAEAGIAGGNPLSQVFAPRSQRQSIVAATWEALEVVGIDDLAGVQAGSLSTGQRRLVELARCVAGGFDLLLLDEPSSGLDAEETQHIASLLQQLVAERGIGVLLVEHDIDLVTSVCRRIHVLDFGQMIASGDPTDVTADPIVQAAYLGAPLAAVEP
jgi:ABC-type branched-subunit amino acid transport system ATPase component